MKKTWIVLAMAAALCAACDESKDEVKCVENQAICDNGQRMVCTSGKFVAIECPNDRICQNGACVTPASATCQTGQLSIPQCIPNSNAIQYCNNGVVKVEPCPAGFKCAANSRGEAYCAKDTAAIDNGDCVENTTRCNISGVLQTCKGNVWTDTPCESGTCQEGKCIECNSGDVTCEAVENSSFVLAKRCNAGKWEVLDTCNTDANMICRSGKCYDKNACKTNDAVQCGDGGVIQTCQNNVWVTTDVCNTGETCHEGSCYDSSLPWKGDPCDENTFTESCSNNDVLYCDEGVVAIYKCLSGSVCTSAPYSYVDDETGKTVNVSGTDCYSDSDICDPTSNKALTSCFSYSVYGYVQSEDECLKADNGKYYQVPMNLTAQCPNGCNGNVCASGGTPSGSGDDTLYDCSTAAYDNNGTTLAAYCQANKGVNSALCIPCSEENFFCADTGNVGQHVGTQYCDAAPSGGGDDTIYDCSNENAGDGKTASDICKAHNGSTVALCIPCNATDIIDCANDTSAVGQHAGTQYCDASPSGGETYYYCGTEPYDEAGTTLDQACASEYGATAKAYCIPSNSQNFWCSDKDLTGQPAESASSDDALYDCSSEAYDNNGTTLGAYCQSAKGISTALCLPCSQMNFFCMNTSYVGQHAGTEYCD